MVTINNDQREDQMRKIKIIKPPKDKWVTVGNTYDVLDSFENWNGDWITVISNDVGVDVDIRSGEFEEIE